MVDPKYILKETAAWTWSLFPNQSYLGRMQLTLRRPCEGSLASLTGNEWLELQSCLKTFETVLTETFAPDRFNYVQLGNVWPQVHVHAIPRYQSAPQWQGISFPDQRWGDVPIPEPASPISEAHTLDLAKELQYKL
ncbi:MAG: hypothetical protein RIC14_16055 [Filomicrobium sp.]